MLFATACGGSDDSSGDGETALADTDPASSTAAAVTDATPTTEPEPTAPESTEPEPEPTEPEATAPDPTEPAPTEDGLLPAAEWAESMITAWNAYLTGQFQAITDAEESQMKGSHFFDVMRAQLSADVEALEAYATALDVQADDPALDASADPMRSLVDERAALAVTAYELGEEDPDLIRQEIDDAEAANPGSLPSTPWGDAFAAYNDDQLFAREQAACFDLQETIDAAGHGLVDCAGSSITQPPIGDLLDPGIHELSVFAPGLTLDLAQPTVVLEAGDFVEVSDPESPVSAKFLAIDEVVDPSSLENPDSQTTMPIPDDLDPWLGQFPISVIADGTIDTTTGTARYWDLRIDADRAAEMAPGSFFIELARYAINPSFASYGPIGGPAGADEHFIIVDWRRGEDRILVYGIDSPDQPLFDWMQTMLAAAS